MYINKYQRTTLPAHKKIRVQLQRLTVQELPAIENLQQLVFDALSDKTLLSKDDTAFLTQNLTDAGIVVGVYHNAALIAYGIINFPGSSQDNLGLDIDLPAKELTKVAHLETQIVHPDYRGNGLQTTLNTLLLQEATSRNYSHVMATVSPHNTISLSNLQDIGMHIVKTKLKYEGKERHIMYMQTQ